MASLSRIHNLRSGSERNISESTTLLFSVYIKHVLQADKEVSTVVGTMHFGHSQKLVPNDWLYSSIGFLLVETIKLMQYQC